MRILIIEEALQENRGHWPAYIGTLARALRKMGDEVDILAHKDCSDSLTKELGATAFLSVNCWTESECQGPLGGLRHSQMYRNDVLAWLNSHPAYDWVFVLTARLQHLLAWARIASGVLSNNQTRLLMLFVQGFGRLGGGPNRIYYPSTLSNKIARTCFHLLGKSIREGEVVLAAETMAMQKELSTFCREAVHLFPHPVEVPKTESASPKEDGRIVVCCPGFARHEKGSALLEEAIMEALKRSNLSRLHFVLQWNGTFTLPDGRKVGASDDLSNHPRVTLQRGNLNQSDFLQMITSSDGVLLPYREEAYYNRLSRIAIESSMLGRPILYTRGTALGELAKLNSGSLQMESVSVEGILDALHRFVRLEKHLKEAAMNHADAVKEYHSVEFFRRCLINKGNR